MEAQNKSTREQILTLLHLHGEMTPKSLAHELSVTPVAVRRHLDTLQREGLVEINLRRQAKGRPAFAFHLTERAFELLPRNYDVLANQLLDAVRGTQGESRVGSLFADRMEQLVHQYQPRMEGKDLRARVAELARIQDESGYMATWESRGDDFVLREQNCSIFRVACRFQEACDHELQLFPILLDARVQRLEHQVQGDGSCTYLIQRKVAGQ